MDTPIPDEPTRRIHQTAARLTTLYELLVKLHYIPSASIKYPPHNPPVDFPFAESLGVHIDPLVIEFLQSIPYVEENDAGLYFGESDALFGGGFIDFRDREQLVGWQRSDPWKMVPDIYGEGNVVQNMHSYVIPLSKLGKTFRIVCLYDARHDTLKIVRYNSRAWDGPWTTDPAVLGVGLPSSIPIVTISNPREVDIDNVAGNSAQMVLGEIIKAYENLEALPTMEASFTSDQLKHLYLGNHWGSGRFDPKAFEVAKARLGARCKHVHDIHNRANALDGVERHTWTLLQLSKRMLNLEQQLTASTTMSSIKEYEIKWQLKQAQLEHRRESRDYQKKTIEREDVLRTSIPDHELPLQELSELTESLYWHDLGFRKQVSRLKDNMDHLEDLPRAQFQDAIERLRSRVDVLRAAWYESKSEMDSVYRANPGVWRTNDYRICLVLNWKQRDNARREHEEEKSRTKYERGRLSQWEEYKGRLELNNAELYDLEAFLGAVPSEVEDVQRQVKYRLHWVKKGIDMIVDSLNDVRKELGIEDVDAEVEAAEHDEL